MEAARGPEGGPDGGPEGGPLGDRTVALMEDRWVETGGWS